MTALPLAGSGRYSIYTGRVTNWPMVIASVMPLPLLVLLAGEPGGSWPGSAAPILVLAVVAIAAEVLTGTSVRAAAGPNGVAVRWGLVGWPRLTYALAEIAHAEVTDLRWWQVSWGFWWTPMRTCCTVRSGPALRLRLTNGRRVTVSVPDPAAAVAALDDARAAQAG